MLTACLIILIPLTVIGMTLVFVIAVSKRWVRIPFNLPTGLPQGPYRVRFCPHCCQPWHEAPEEDNEVDYTKDSGPL